MAVHDFPVRHRHLERKALPDEIDHWTWKIIQQPPPQLLPRHACQRHDEAGRETGQEQRQPVTDKVRLGIHGVPSPETSRVALIALSKNMFYFFGL